MMRNNGTGSSWLRIWMIVSGCWQGMEKVFTKVKGIRGKGTCVTISLMNNKYVTYNKHRTICDASPASLAQTTTYLQVARQTRKFSICRFM